MVLAIARTPIRDPNCAAVHTDGSGAAVAVPAVLQRPTATAPSPCSRTERSSSTYPVSRSVTRPGRVRYRRDGSLLVGLDGEGSDSDALVIDDDNGAVV
jgi:hypothetical protein